MNLHSIPKEKPIFVVTDDIKRAIIRLNEIGWPSFLIRTVPSPVHQGQPITLSVFGLDDAGGGVEDVGVQYFNHGNTDLSLFESLDVRIEYA